MAKNPHQLVNIELRPYDLRHDAATYVSRSGSSFPGDLLYQYICQTQHERVASEYPTCGTPILRYNSRIAS